MNRKQIVIVLIVISGALFVLSLATLFREIPLFERQEGKINDRPGYLRYIPTILVFTSGLIIASLVFLYYFPDLRPNKTKRDFPQASAFNIITYISNDDEEKILHAIKARNNKAYQFELSQDTGLNRMKVHRVVRRLIERDILVVRKVGKNKLLRLSDWIQN
ncbi:MAG: helix-turn-helix transcriptional regulator [Candidatus Kariarchaeaceae archaeon]